MAWNKKQKEEEEEVVVEQITYKDVEKLRAALKAFPQRMINGQLVSSFDQYLCSLGVMKYSNDGVVIHDGAGFTRMSKINAKMELLDYYKDRDFMEQNPEAKTAFQERMTKLREKHSLTMKV